MPEEDMIKRTELPDAEAEGAGNFAAEPATDPTAGPPPDNVATRMDEQMPTPGSVSTPAGEAGNRTGGDPPEEVAARRAGSEEEEAGIEQELRETDQASNPNL